MFAPYNPLSCKRLLLEGVAYICQFSSIKIHHRNQIKKQIHEFYRQITKLLVKQDFYPPRLVPTFE
jgi:hypothetical protein